MIEPFFDRWGKEHYFEADLALVRSGYFAIIIKNGMVLLSSLPRHDLFEFPGGGLNRGEDYKTCLVRELYEETGYEFALGSGNREHKQLVNFFAEHIRPAGECRKYSQTFIFYDADNYGLEIKEGTWSTPENGHAKWVEFQDLLDGKIELNYMHRKALDALFPQN